MPRLVCGARAYRVGLSVDRGRLVWSCSCPIGVSGECCKHVVAVAVVLAGDVETAAHRLLASRVICVRTWPPSMQVSSLPSFWNWPNAIRSSMTG